MSATELAKVKKVLAAMPQLKGEPLELYGTVGQPPVLLEGSSELWGKEPVADIVQDLHTKLNALTLIRHFVPDTEWAVDLAGMQVPWNPTERRFEPPD